MRASERPLLAVDIAFKGSPEPADGRARLWCHYFLATNLPVLLLHLSTLNSHVGLALCAWFRKLEQVIIEV